eukprot:CAMPEP_0171192700 /NCGR_PEP_ID=MMETSP0790-20130122/20004_1 /TAXON_ID=2925 /ORGANISM="Alexandrium catenella, Strain OF101" /LENGTH=516 /DNA_ID=CAMNT_0011657865 /DNA_START=17 /DNA_END=1568 /DNA_ORIENTATION=-
MAGGLGKQVPAVAALLLLGVGDCLIIRETETAAKISPYRELVNRATEWCYKKLVNDSSCCLDSQLPSGLRQREVRRPGTYWNCSKPLCRSELLGERGKDHIWVPPEASCSSPRILYIHGGSWTSGSPITSGYQQFTAKMALATGAMVMAIDYPLVSSRSATFLGGEFEEIMDFTISAMRWLASNGPSEDCPASIEAPLFVGGDSSGGGSALSLALKLGMDRGLLPGRRLTGAFLYSPWTNLQCNSPEYYHNAFAKIEENTFKRMSAELEMYKSRSSVKPTDQTHTPVLAAYVGDVIFRSPPGNNSKVFEMSAVGYTGGNASKLTDPVASPYYADESQLSGLPPLYVAVGSSESILGDSIVVAENAAASGVDVHLDIHPGMWHVFPMYSEGCGGDTPLWNGVRAMNSTALFVRHLSKTGTPPYVVTVRGPEDTGKQIKQPYTTISYSPGVPSLAMTDAEVGQHLGAIKKLQASGRADRCQVHRPRPLRGQRVGPSVLQAAASRGFWAGGPSSNAFSA